MENHDWVCGICHGDAGNESENIVVGVEESVSRDVNLLDIQIRQGIIRA